MDQKEMIERLKRDPAALQSLINSPDAQTLMRMLQGSDGGRTLEQAAANASAGNTERITQMLRSIMSTPGGAQLIKRIARSIEK